MKNPKNFIWVALDVDNLIKALELVDQLAPFVGGFKVGLELINREGGPQVVEAIHKLGGGVFYDIKLNDISNTMEKASKAISSLGVKMFNVMASSGVEGMKAALEGARSAEASERWIPGPNTLQPGHSDVMGVTVLTSFNDEESEHVYGLRCSKKVLKFSRDILDAGLCGIICSPMEAKMIRESAIFDALTLITPGIRPIWAPSNDQKRFVTPKEALNSGIDGIVIGRPITDPPENIGTPMDAVKLILEELAGE